VAKEAFCLKSATVRGGAPTAQKFSTIFSTQDGLSWHDNIVNCGLSCSHRAARPQKSCLLLIDWLIFIKVHVANIHAQTVMTTWQNSIKEQASQSRCVYGLMLINWCERQRTDLSTPCDWGSCTRSVPTQTRGFPWLCNPNPTDTVHGMDPNPRVPHQLQP